MLNFVRRWAKFILIPLLVIGVAVAGAVTGIWMDRSDFPSRIANLLEASVPAPEEQEVEWRDLPTHYHRLQVASFRVSRVAIYGGSLAEVGDNIVLASPHGHLNYLNSQNHLASLDIATPMNMAEVRASPLYEDVRFNAGALRTHDLLAIETGPGRYDLYASYDRFRGECIEFVVSRIPLSVNGGEITVTGEWEDAWVATPCLRLKNRGRLISDPPQAGGRMVRFSDDEILVALGDQKRDGVNDSESVSMDPSVDFGKIIVLNIRTGASRQLAIGLRNPQGLTIDRAGRIWETEHGPQGGDEINLIWPGANYGWPIVTYGTQYGSPPTRWPNDTHMGGHDGYTRPRFAFLPSIGISNLIAPDPDEFPYWSETLLVSAMRSQSLYVTRIDSDDIVYTEPVQLDFRLRDMISLRDGRIAILADGGTLLFVRNADRHADGQQGFTVTGLADLPAPEVDEVPRPDVSEAELGGAHFRARCASCHSVDGENEAGPPLNGIYGRDIASHDGFAYSRALTRLEGEWTPQRLAAFMRDPQSIAPGTTMPASDLSPEQAEQIALYLRQER